MVEVARYITVNMVDVLIACVAKEIPLTKAFAVFVPGTLALIRRRGGIMIKMTSTDLNHRRTTKAV